jgi:hypothetical protein
MKLTKKHLNSFLLFILLGILIGTLGWEIFERILSHLDIPLSLKIDPIGFDLVVLSIKMMINPGTFIGLVGGIILFKTM